MITKALLSEVLGLESYICEKAPQTTNVRYKFDCIGEKRDSSINIHELAHRCKEWAFKQGYELQSRIMSNDSQKRGNCCILKAECEYESCIKIENAHTEPEAIFAACQWLLDHKGD